MAGRRFKLRTVLGLIAIIAVGLATVPQIRHYIYWREARNAVAAWAKEIDRSTDTVHCYEYVHMRLEPSSSGGLDANGQTYMVFTAEPTKVVALDGSIDWKIGKETANDPTGFFVVPPGIWVESVGEVVWAWDRHSSEVVQ